MRFVPAHHSNAHFSFSARLALTMPSECLTLRTALVAVILVINAAGRSICNYGNCDLSDVRERIESAIQRVFLTYTILDGHNVEGTGLDAICESVEYFGRTARTTLVVLPVAVVRISVGDIYYRLERITGSGVEGAEIKRWPDYGHGKSTSAYIARRVNGGANDRRNTDWKIRTRLRQAGNNHTTTVVRSIREPVCRSVSTRRISSNGNRRRASYFRGLN